MSLFGILQSTAASLINTQAQIGVVSENLGNSQTPGYVSRQAVIEDINPTAGGGTQIVDIERAVDQTLQQTLLGQSTINGGASYLNGIYQQLEQLTGSATGTPILSSAMQQFQQAWTAFQTSPEDNSAQYAVVSAANNLTQTVQSLSAGIEAIQTQVEGSVSTDMTTLNQALQRIATDNIAYVSAKADGQSTASIEDDRDTAVATIANLLPIQVSTNADGTLAVRTPGGLSLVSDAQVAGLSYNATTNTVYSTNDPNQTSLNGTITGGQISAELAVLNTSAAQTTSLSLNATIGASTTSPPPIETEVYDATGTAHAATIQLTNTGTNTWTASISVAGDLNSGAATPPSTYDVDLTFSPGGAGNPPAGTLVSMTSTNPDVTVPGTQTTNASASLGLAMSFPDATGNPVTQNVSLNLGTFGALGSGLTQPAGTSLSVQSVTQGGISTGSATNATAAPLEKMRQQLNAFVDLFYAAPPAAPTAFQAAYNNAQQVSTTELASDIFNVGSAATGNERFGFQVNPALLTGASTLKLSSGTPVMTQLAGATLSFNTAGVQITNGTYQSVADGIGSDQSSRAAAATTLSTTASANYTATQTLYDNKTGVNSDQQLSLLIQLQNSYNASAKVISVIQDMASTLEAAVTPGG